MKEGFGHGTTSVNALKQVGGVVLGVLLVSVLIFSMACSSKTATTSAAATSAAAATKTLNIGFAVGFTSGTYLDAMRAAELLVDQDQRRRRFINRQ